MSYFRLAIAVLLLAVHTPSAPLCNLGKAPQGSTFVDRNLANNYDNWIGGHFLIAVSEIGYRYSHLYTLMNGDYIVEYDTGQCRTSFIVSPDDMIKMWGTACQGSPVWTRDDATRLSYNWTLHSPAEFAEEYLIKPHVAIVNAHHVIVDLNKSQMASSIVAAGFTGKLQAQSIAQRSFPECWPVGIGGIPDSRTLRMMEAYVAYLVADLTPDIVLLYIPASRNQHVPIEVRPRDDFFLHVERKGVWTELSPKPNAVPQEAKASLGQEGSYCEAALPCAANLTCSADTCRRKKRQK